MELNCDQQMAFVSTLKLVASSCDHVGTHQLLQIKTIPILPIKVVPSIPGNQRMGHADRVRRSIELLDPKSLESLRLGTFKQSHDVFFELTLIVQERQQCLDLAAEVSDLEDDLLMEFVQQLTIMNQIDRQEILYELELLDRFTQQLQHE